MASNKTTGGKSDWELYNPSQISKNPQGVPESLICCLAMIFSWLSQAKHSKFQGQLKKGRSFRETLVPHNQPASLQGWTSCTMEAGISLCCAVEELELEINPLVLVLVFLVFT